MPAAVAHENANRRALRRCCSRRRNASYPTPSSPEISLSLALFLPSLPGRASAAIGSVRAELKLPSLPRRKRRAGGRMLPACPALRQVAGIRFAADDDAEDPVFAPEALERENLLVDPLRL